VSGSDDKTVRIWDAILGTVQHTLKGHTSFVTLVAFSSDDLRIVSGSYDRTVCIWDAISGTIQHTLEGYTDGESLSSFLATSALQNGWLPFSMQNSHRSFLILILIP
jgi:WD40 repeat protein